jgi:hypothetical protein
MLRADLQAAGIEYCDANGRVFDFHSLRHQYLADAGIHPRTAQELARHSSIDLTMKRYTHLAPRTIIGAVESIPEPGTTFGAPNVGNRGDERVTAEGAKQGQKWPKASETQKDNLRPRKMKTTPANTGVS